MRATVKLISTFLLILTGISSCKDDKTIENPVKSLITEIRPEGGVPGMTVTISGAHFTTDTLSNNVTFNGVEAIVLKAKEDELLVEVPEGGATGIISVTNEGGTVDGPSFRYYDVYAVMSERILGKNLSIKVWHNGSVTTISDDETWCNPIDMAVEGDDVYIAGAKGYSGVYWKNGTEVYVADSAVVARIATWEQDVYLAGAAREKGVWKTKYWKNGQEMDVPDGLYGDVFDLEVINGSVYIAGTKLNEEGQPFATVWKDGIPLTMKTDYSGIAIYDLFVDNDGNIYAAGTGRREGQNSPSMIVWRNGIENVWTDGSTPANPAMITKHKNDVFIIGSGGALISTAMLWENKIETQLSDGIINASGVSIQVIGNDVITSGFYDAGNSTLTFVAFNTQLVPLVENYEAEAKVIGVSVR